MLNDKIVFLVWIVKNENVNAIHLNDKTLLLANIEFRELSLN